MRVRAQVSLGALGLVLLCTLTARCVPLRQPAQIHTSDGAGESRPPIVLPTSTPSFRLTPTRAPTLLPSTIPLAMPRPAAPLLWIGGKGCLTALGPGGWQTFEVSGIVRDIAVDANGNAIVAPGLRTCNGRLLRDLQPRAPGGEQDAVAIDGRGRVWVGYYGGIAVLDGGQWTLIPLGSGASTRAKTVHDLAIDAQGVVWVATGEGLVSYDGHAWQTYAGESGPGTSVVERLLVDGQGRLWVAHEKGLSVRQGKSWELYGLEVVGRVHLIAVDAQGRILALSPERGLTLFDGGQVRPLTIQDASVPVDRITALACDGDGRIWAGTRDGLSVYDGEHWLTYQEANSGLGHDHVSALAVVGGGLPDLPPRGATRYGGLAGQVTVRRQPVPGVRVALCPELSLGQGFADVPCEGSRFSLVTRTGVDGRYLFERVPLGHYAVAAEIQPGYWVAPMRVRSAMQYQVREGQTTVVDTIEGED